MKQILFFATKEDLLPILRSVETGESLSYTRTGNFTTPALEAFPSGANIPNLGRATSESAIASATYLVHLRSSSPRVRVLKGQDGGQRYCVDQLLNPDTVAFTPSGVWNDEVVLHGRVATTSDSAGSQALMRRFHAAIKKGFVKVRAFYVGPQAHELLKVGKRLTIAAQSPREFDLGLKEGSG